MSRAITAPMTEPIRPLVRSSRVCPEDQARQQAPDERSDDPKQRGAQDADPVSTRNDQPCQATGDQPDEEE